MTQEPWRTDTVRAICESMRQARDFSGAPILADALQDADYPDDKVLAELRDPVLDPVRAEALVARLYSPESAAAVDLLEAFAARVGYSYAKVVTGARTYADTGESYAGTAGCDNDYPAAWAAQGAFYDPNGDPFELDAKRLNEFFTALELVTGRPVDPERRTDVPFTCPC